MKLKLVLVRHGQSEGNVDESVYHKIPDHRIQLTELGRQQAADAGLALSLDNSPLSTHIVHSPFDRARHTAEIILEHVRCVSFSEDPLIHEMSIVHSYSDLKTQDTFNSPEREAYSTYWYKQGTSESYADAYTRARIFYQDLMLNTRQYQDGDTVIVVAHAIILLMLEGVINGWSVKEILEEKWLSNCERRVFNLTIKD